MSHRAASVLLSGLIAAAGLAACGDPEVDPEVYSGVEEGEWLPGGETTNTLLFGRNAFISPVSNILPEHEPLFYSGNSYFNQAWVEPPASTTTRDGLGPLFNARSCAACHLHDGRGQPPAPGEDTLALLLRLSVPGAASGEAPLPEPRYGGQLQPYGVQGVPGEGRPVAEETVVVGAFEDGAMFELLHPRWRIEEPAYGPLSAGVEISPRVAPQMIGLGLLEAIPTERLEALADPDDADGDGISGRVARLPGTAQPGRFGWKGEQPTVREQSAGAFLGDLGLTTSLHPAQECSPGQEACRSALEGGSPEVDDAILERVAVYSALLAVPARGSWDDPEVLQGKRLFRELGCAGCHVPRHETGEHPSLPELSGQAIWPYTDLLLHDMGPELADGRPVFAASGSEWRTPPLWGIGRFQAVNGHTRLLHDGRARGVAEAILWHGGEGEESREGFAGLEAAERDALVRFVESL
jgi:CxxC motif-containing protein (DUF1111 family)